MQEPDGQYSLTTTMAFFYIPGLVAAVAVAFTPWFRTVVGRLWMNISQRSIDESDLRGATLRLIIPIRTFLVAMIVVLCGFMFLAPSTPCCGRALWDRWFDSDNQLLASVLLALFAAALSSVWAARDRGIALSEAPPRMPWRSQLAPDLFVTVPVAFAGLVLIAVSAAIATSTVAPTNQFGHAASVAYLVIGGISTTLFLIALRRPARRRSPDVSEEWDSRARSNARGMLLGVSVAAALMSLHQSLDSFAVAWREDHSANLSSALLDIASSFSGGGHAIGFVVPWLFLFGYFLRPVRKSPHSRWIPDGFGPQRSRIPVPAARGKAAKL
jgi:hypothetical protein